MSMLRWPVLVGVVGVLAVTGCGEGGAVQQEAGRWARLEQEVAGPVDLSIASVVAPTSVLAGSTYAVTVQVCNTGTGTTASSVSVYLSTDSTIGTADTLAGSAPVPTLVGGQCALLNVSANTAGLTSSRVVGAIVDVANQVAESNETNNTRAGARMGIGSGPDFIVSAVSGPAAALPGGSFTTSVDVCNQGTTSGATSVDVYLSTDATIGTTDTLVGSGSTGSLAPQQCTTLSIPASTSLTSGNLFIGAFADRTGSVVELNESNNTLAGNRLLLGTGPDLTVSEVSGPALISSSTPFSASATICNQGTASSSATSVLLYLSVDASITSADSLAASASLGALAAGQCSTVALSASGVSLTGAYFLGAIVDGSNTVAELNEGNNSRAGPQAGIGSRPDFVVTTVSSQGSVLAGASFATTTLVCNQGNASGSTSVDVVLSADASITTSDTVVGTGTTVPLAAGVCTLVSISATASVAAGTWHLGALADRAASVAELNEGNNSRAGQRLGVGSGPDLVVSQVSGSAYGIPGGPFTATATVCNQGNAASGSTSVELRLSRDTTLNAMDLLLGTAPLPSLAPGQCQEARVSANAPAPQGTWYVGAFADSTGGVQELIEDNNSTTGSTSMLANLPDLVLTSVNGRPLVGTDTPSTTLFTVCNEGTLSSPALLSLVLSTDSTINLSDVPLATSLPIPALATGQCHTGSAVISYPQGGDWYLGAIADTGASNSELREDNNTRASQVTARGPGGDLAIATVSAPASAPPSGAFTARVNLCNRGNTYVSLYTTVQLKLSADSSITADDMTIGSAEADWMFPESCMDVFVNGYAPYSPGTWYLGAIADASNRLPEPVESDNTAVGDLFTVGSDPNLIVSSLRAPAQAAPAGLLSATATVCNSGAGYSFPSTVALRLSADTDFTSADTMLARSDVPLLDAGGCVEVSLNASVPASPGAWFLAATVDPTSSVPELREEDNTSPVSRLGIGSGPDLVISSLGGPPSVAPGSPFTATATVCNQGSVPAPASQVAVRLLLQGYAVADSFPAGSAPVPSLAAGACQQVSVTCSVPSLFSASSPTPFTLAAQVDPSLSVTELIEDNNSSSGPRLGFGWYSDLVITSVSPPLLSYSGVTPFAFATVCNRGTQGAAYGMFQAHTSVDPSLDLNQDRFTYYTDLSLAPGACTRIGFPVSSPPQDTWYLSTLALHSVGSELFTDDNALFSQALASSDKPDLVIASVSAPASAAQGSFTAQATICNRGFAMNLGYGTFVELRLSTDALITRDDPSVGHALLDTLAPGQCTVVSIPVTTNLSTDTWYLGVLVDPYNSIQEAIESNNLAAERRITFGSGPNLTVSSLRAPALAAASGPLSATATVCNSGTSSSPTSFVSLRLSTDTDFTPADTVLATSGVPTLAAGACTDISLNASAPASPGTWFLAATVDLTSSVSELREEDNTSPASRLGIGSGPDLVVSALSGPSGVAQGAPFTATATLCNQGPVSAPASQVAVLVSPQGYAAADSFPVGSASVPSLAPGACAPVSVDCAFPPFITPSSPMSFTLSARADSSSSITELIEDNNSISGPSLGYGSFTDFTITSVSTPSSVAANSYFNITTTLCNQGTAPSYSSQVVDLFLSSDTQITYSDFLLRPVYVGPMDPGQCVTLDFPVQASQRGAWFPGVYINTRPEQELSVENNTRAGSVLTVN